MKFKRLCISGGGIKGFSQLGALEWCEKKNLLQDIHIYSGTSIGSAIATLLCAGYKSGQIYGSFLKINILPDIGNLDFLQLPIKYGLIDSDTFADSIRILLRKKFDKVPTLKQFYDLTQKEIYISAINIDKSEIVYFHYLNHPNLDVVDAIKMSCNLPLIFTRLEYKGDSYIDGGLAVHIPFKIIDNDKEAVLNIVTSGFGMNISALRGLVNYILKIMIMPIKALEKFQRQTASDMCYFIDINADDIVCMNTFLEEKEKEKLWLRGYQMAKKWYEDQKIEEMIEWGWDDEDIDL